MNIYGASGHGKVIAEIIASNTNLSIDHVFDDNLEIEEFLGHKVFHTPSSQMLTFETILAIGNNHIRKKVATKFQGNFHAAICHSSAIISKGVELGKGTAVMPNAVINPAAKVGEHCILNTAAVIEHDVILEDFVHISPGAVITGNVEIGEGSHIGAGATIIPGIKIGKWVTVGAGTVIIENIPDFAVVVGNPGKIIKLNKLVNE